MTTPAPENEEVVAPRPTIVEEKKRGFISPTSSFVDFVELKSEYFTEEGKQQARLGFYDPHNARQIKKPVTNIETCIHLLKGSVGAGMLAMPKAFYHSGYVLGIVGSILIGALCTYSMIILLKMQLIQCKRLQVPFLTLPRSMRIAFLNGPKLLRPFACCAPYMVDFFLVAYQLGICSAYIAFIASTIKELLEPNIIKKDSINERLFMLMILIPVLLLNYIRNLKKLYPLSLVGNFLIIVALISIFYFIFNGDPFKVKEAKAVAPVATWPLFIGTVLFALEAVGVIIALEHNMEKPKSFLGWKGIFPWSLTGVVTLYMSVGLLGYLRFGEKFALPENGTIIAVLPSDFWYVKNRSALSTAIRIIYIFVIYLTYPLQCYVSLEIIWGNYLVQHIQDRKKECIVEYALRTIVVIITFIFSLMIVKVDLVISFVGAFCLSFLGIIFPFVLELCTLWPDDLGPYKYVLYKDIILILVGFLILFVGTYCSINEVVGYYNKEHK